MFAVFRARPVCWTGKGLRTFLGCASSLLEVWARPVLSLDSYRAGSKEPAGSSQVFVKQIAALVSKTNS